LTPKQMSATLWDGEERDRWGIEFELSSLAHSKMLQVPKTLYYASVFNFVVCSLVLVAYRIDRGFYARS